VKSGLRRAWRAAAAVGALLAMLAPRAAALNPARHLTQYSRTVWTQEHGLPQDTIRAIAQTPDGYLWIGTDEGLARFDGYDFTVFDRTEGNLPNNSVAALAASADGSLWIGTPDGLVQYRDRNFRTFTTAQGLPENNIVALYADHADTLWIVAGINLCRYREGRFTTFASGSAVPLASVRTVREDRHHNLLVAGFGGVVEMSGGRFVPLVGGGTLGGNIVQALLSDRHDNLWIGGTAGVLVRSPSGQVRRYGESEGLPNTLVRALWEDRDGTIWAGTNGGLARLEHGRFDAATEDDRGERGQVRSVFEDSEGDLWIGSNSGLIRYRDSVMTVYGKSEGWPSDEPNAVYQDRGGRIWVGFHDSGLMSLGPQRRLYTTREGLPNNEVFSIRETPSGDLLLGVRGGLVRMHDGHPRTLVPPDSLKRTSVFDALEDPAGHVWLAAAAGLFELAGGKLRVVVPSEPLLSGLFVALCLGHDGSIWAGTYGKGLFHVQGGSVRQYTTSDGLSSDQVRSLYQDPAGTLWISTFGGGLAALRNGRFEQFRGRDGLPSDNVAKVMDDGQSLWLSTTRGICVVPRKQLEDFAAGRRRALDPVNYGVEDGLRSAQCAPSYPIGGGGYRTADGRLWFTTSRGVAVMDPAAKRQVPLPPTVQLLDVNVDGRSVDLARAPRLGPDFERIQFRYTGIHLSGPEQVRYSYRLEGLNADWVPASNRRLINYNSLRHGGYRFLVRAEIPGAPPAEQVYPFEVLPRYYETAWFRALCAVLVIAAGWAVYGVRLRQIRYRFALVLEERARLAREIHDTLAQGFVGISSQLDAVALLMPDENAPARRYLDLARRMARHSLTEARRSVMDLRASVLEGQNLAAALESGTRLWTAGSGVDVAVGVDGQAGEIPQEMEQHLLRIAQEAVANALKHSRATRIWITLHMEARKLYLRIKDNGQGFDQDGAFLALGGHFGLIGMRERAERLGGEMRLASNPGEGTEVEVKVPLP